MAPKSKENQAHVCGQSLLCCYWLMLRDVELLYGFW